MVSPLPCPSILFFAVFLCHSYGDVLVHKIRDLFLIDTHVDISRKDLFFKQ